MPNENIFTISEATKYIKSLIQEDVLLQHMWIRGELSNVKMHSRGHLYFTVKDEKSRIQAVMFAGYNRYLSFKPENGMKVLIRGEVDVYEPFGQYQFYAKEMQPDGIGSLYLAYEKLKEKLEKEGLFAKERKKDIPAYPKRIAIVTSPTGAVISDIITTIRRRYPIVQLSLFPVLVQGEHAPQSITYAIEQVKAANCFDLLIVGRGGGSIEELWGFNDEQVARAIASSPIPVISAVGHETDYTISDFVADLRAPTPTAAAELAVPDQRALIQSISSFQLRLTRAMQAKYDRAKNHITQLKRSYAFRYPEQLLRQKEQQLDHYMDRFKRECIHFVTEKTKRLTFLSESLHRVHPFDRVKVAKEKLAHLQKSLIAAMYEQIEKKRQPFQTTIGELQLLSPLRLMDRGYSVVYDTDEKTVIQSIQQAEIGKELIVRLKDGKVNCVVNETERIEGGK